MGPVIEADGNVLANEGINNNDGVGAAQGNPINQPAGQNLQMLHGNNVVEIMEQDIENEELPPAWDHLPTNPNLIPENFRNLAPLAEVNYNGIQYVSISYNEHKNIIVHF